MTATNQLGIRQNNVVVPYTAANIRTKWIDISSNITCTNFTATSAKAMFYADSNSQWVMRVQITGSFSVATNNPAFTISGISSIAAAQSLLCTATDGSGLDIVIGECTLASSSNIITAYGIGIKNSITISNDVLLSANPTTYTTTANMEGVTACDVYIQPATATTAGVVDTGTQTWAGNKTFNGVVTVANTTDATSSAGALVVEGGICCKKKLYVGTSLGIGVAPAANLDVYNATAHAANIELARLRWSTASATSGDSGDLNFTNLAGTALGRIANRHDGTNVGLSFWGWNNSAGALQEHVTILGTGLVGIGTTGPSTKLHVYGSADAAVTTTISSQNSGSSCSARMQLAGYGSGANFIYNGSGNTSYAGANSLNICNLTNKPIAFYVSDTTQAMIIDGTGKVGIGTGSPGRMLDALGDSGIRCVSSSTVSVASIGGHGTGALSLGNGAARTVTVIGGDFSWFVTVCNGSGDAGLWFCSYASGTVTELRALTGFSVTKSASSYACAINNNSGGASNIKIQVIGAGIASVSG